MSSNFSVVGGDWQRGYTAAFTRLEGLPKLQAQVSAVVRRAIERERRNSMQRTIALPPNALKLRLNTVIRDALSGLARAHKRLVALGIETAPEELLGQVEAPRIEVGADPREVFYAVSVRSQASTSTEARGVVHTV